MEKGVGKFATETSAAVDDLVPLFDVSAYPQE